MCMTSSLIGIEGECLENVVIDGTWRPKRGYPSVHRYLRYQPAPRLHSDKASPWMENESAYRHPTGPSSQPRFHRGTPDDAPIQRDRPPRTIHRTQREKNRRDPNQSEQATHVDNDNDNAVSTQRTGLPPAQPSARLPPSTD